MNLRSRISALLAGVLLITSLSPRVLVAEEGGLSRSGHMTRGVLNLTLVGLQLGLGLGLRAQEPNPDISLRALHMSNNLVLLGLGIFELGDLLSTKPSPENSVHRTLGYTYLALLASTFVLGLIRVRAYSDRADPGAKLMGDIHTGFGIAAAGALVGSAITLKF